MTLPGDGDKTNPTADEVRQAILHYRAKFAPAMPDVDCWHCRQPMIVNEEVAPGSMVTYFGGRPTRAMCGRCVKYIKEMNTNREAVRHFKLSHQEELGW